MRGCKKGWKERRWGRWEGGRREEEVEGRIKRGWDREEGDGEGEGGRKGETEREEKRRERERVRERWRGDGKGEREEGERSLTSNVT